MRMQHEQADHQITAGECRFFQAIERSGATLVSLKTWRGVANVSEGSSCTYLKRFLAFGLCEKERCSPPHYRLADPSTAEGKAYRDRLKALADVFPLGEVSA